MAGLSGLCWSDYYSLRTSIFQQLDLQQQAVLSRWQPAPLALLAHPARLAKLVTGRQDPEFALLAADSLVDPFAFVVAAFPDVDFG